jgi:transposase
MGNPRGVKRDRDALCALEQRRRSAAALLHKGWKQADVARHLGISPMSVSRWAKALSAGGIRELRSAGRTGRRPRLSDPQRKQVTRVLQEGPEAHGYATGLWTLPRVAAVIGRECGVIYHPGHVWRLLRDLGWSCQRPAGKALERDEEAIRRWQRYTWPALKKKPSAKAAISSLSTKAD